MLFKKDEIEQLSSLEREKQQFDKELTLEQTEAELIKDYVMKEGTYKIIITLYELNDLEPKSFKIWKFNLAQKSACDSFVQISVNDQTKQTSIKPATNNPIFDEQFFFEFPDMTVEQLDRAKILFNVYDTKFWGQSDSLIGSFQLDWTNVYFKRNHEIYRSWLTLYDPNHQLDGPVGYLLANIAVLGPNDQITIHDSAFIKDPLVTIEDTITSPKLPLIDYAISVQIYRAQGLVPIDFLSSQVRAYIITKFSGNKVKTSDVKSLNPEWNECIKIGSQVPNKSKYITLQVRNKNLFTNDDIIGVLKIPFIDILQDQDPQPRWGHLYGPPIAGKDVEPTFYATKMQVYGDKIGSHYRGRLLYKITGKKDSYTKNIKNKLVFKFPYRVIPVIPLKLYMLRVDLIQGFGLPRLQKCYIQICIGQYTIKTKSYTIKDGFCEFFDMLDQKKLNLPENLDSLPDLVVYFCNGLNQENRLGYIRIKASQIFNSNHHFDEVKVHEMKFDKSINHKEVKGSCGFIACRLQLFRSAKSNPQRTQISQKMKLKPEFQLRVFLYQGENFSPANEQGDCDPMIKFSFDDKLFESESVMSTYNPIWNQVLSEKVKIQDLFSFNMQKCLICDVYDYEQSKKHNYMGSFSVKMNASMKRNLKLSGHYKDTIIDFIYSKPKWCYVINPNIEIGNPVFGRVLISCSIFKKQYQIGSKTVSFREIEKQCNFYKIKTETLTKSINFFMIGIRNLKINQEETLLNALKRNATGRSLASVNVKPSIRMNYIGEQKSKDQRPLQLTETQSDKNEKQVDLETTDSDNRDNQQHSFPLKNCGAQINKVYKFNNVEIPKNKSLSTYAEFKVTDESGNRVYGSNSINLRTLRNIFEDEDSTEATRQEKMSDDILDVENLQIKLKRLDVLNKINAQIEQEKQAAKFISKIRIETVQAKQLIPPQELETKNIKNNPGIQEQIQMKKLIEQFEIQLKNIDKNDQNQMAYIKYNASSSSNNFPQNKNPKHFNLIDAQSTILNKYNNSEVRMEKMSDLLSEYELDDDKVALIDSLPQKTLKNQHQNRDWPQQVQNNRDGSSKNLIREVPSNHTNNGFLKTKNGQTSHTFKKTINQTNSPTITNAEGFGKKTLAHFEKTFNHMLEKQAINDKIKNDMVSNFNLNESLVLSDKQHPQKAIKYREVQKGLQMEQEHKKQAIQKQIQYKYANAVKLSLFKWMRKDPIEKQKQTYQDYDTDEEQSLDIIPEWYRGRKILANDLEHFLEKSRRIQNIPIFRGRKIDGLETRVKQQVGMIKMVVLSEKNNKELRKKAQQYQSLLRQKEFSCRIYVLKGKSLLTRNLEKPNTYLRFIYGQKVTQYKDKLVKNENNPEYYMCHEQWIKLPGSSTIRIQVMEALYLIGSVGDSLVKDKMVGYTEIDVEDRYFIKKWHLLQKKPIQLRNLYSEFGVGTQGRLETWIDLVQKKKWLIDPPIKITPPPWDEYELRVIVWGTKDCVYKNQQMESNDVFVRGFIGKSNFQETDVHWACRSVGSFNYRFKFPVFYPAKPQDMYSDIFTVQIWDKDVIGFDNLIGQTRINLNQMHKLIQKAVKRKKPVSAVKKIIQKNMKSTDRFWFDVYNHKEKDEFGQVQSQGRVQLSFQLVPMENAKSQRSNGFGRSDPNVYPTLAQPTGRLSFDVLHPLGFIKQILGPNLYRSLCVKFFLILIIALVILMFVFFGTSIVAGLVARK